jgi:hypothetical protein
MVNKELSFFANNGTRTIEALGLGRYALIRCLLVGSSVGAAKGFMCHAPRLEVLLDDIKVRAVDPHIQELF